MLNELTTWPQKLKAGWDLAQTFHNENKNRLPHTVKKIAFLGMGGSGIAGRIIKTFLDAHSDITSIVVDSPTLPGSIDRDTFALAMSYSGNTWETLEGLEALIGKAIPTLILSHGGTATKLALEKNIPHALIPQTSAPRAALGYFLGFILGLLDCMKVLNGKKIYDEFLKILEHTLPKLENSGFFDDFFNYIGTSEVFSIWGVSSYSDAMAYRAQTQFNENTKVKALFSAFPELCHNLLVGFTHKATTPYPVIFFVPQALPRSLSVAADSLCELLEEEGLSLYKPPLLGDTLTQQLFYSIIWSDFASYYLAQRRGVDAMPVKLIELLKAKYTEKMLK
jgi:glucose/mannose-6-phosphate isomerase